MACSDVRTAYMVPCPSLTRDEWASGRSVLRRGRSLKYPPLVAVAEPGMPGTIKRLPYARPCSPVNTASSLFSLYDSAPGQYLPVIA